MFPCILSCPLHPSLLSPSLSPSHFTILSQALRFPPFTLYVAPLHFLTCVVFRHCLSEFPWPTSWRGRVLHEPPLTWLTCVLIYPASVPPVTWPSSYSGQMITLLGVSRLPHVVPYASLPGHPLTCTFIYLVIELLNTYASHLRG